MKEATLQALSHVLRRVPELAIFVVVVYIFVGSQERVAKTCHVHQKSMALAFTKSIDAHTEESRRVGDLLIAVKTVMENR